MKELEGAILPQNHGHSQGDGPGGPGHLNQKFDKKALFFNF